MIENTLRLCFSRAWYSTLDRFPGLHCNILSGGTCSKLCAYAVLRDPTRNGSECSGKGQWQWR